MDKLKGVAKGGWKPSRDRPIHRDTWKTDLKGIATGKKNDPNEAARNHQSAPLTALRDPDAFGPPPKHTGVPRNGSGSSSTPATPTSPARPPAAAGGWGSIVPTEASKQRLEEAAQREAEEEAAKKPSGPYKTDTTGLRTDNLPPPPVRRIGDVQAPATPPRTTIPTTARPPPALPSRLPQSHPPPQQQRAPPPILPPRQNENVDEFTPAPPPPYHEATQPTPQNPAALNAGAISRLSQAGISVPGFGIGNNDTSQAQPATRHTGQLSELQQRFARMNAGQQHPTETQSPTSAAPAPAHKKPPPPPPPKKPGLGHEARPGSSDAGSSLAPPPLPLSSKPRPPS